MGIRDLPGESTFGEQFSYAAWTAGSSVLLCNVPWNSDYRDIVKFEPGGLDAYLFGQGTTHTIEIDQLTYLRPGQPVRINVPFNAAYQFNYLRVSNPAQPVPGGDTPRALYYFIGDVRHVAPNTTELILQLDVWQTFGPGTRFGNCYIERGHIGIANADQFDDYGRTYLTVPEGLDVGGEYQVHARTSVEVASARQPGAGTPNYEVVIISTTSLTDSPGTTEAPNLATAQGSDWESIPNGTDTYILAYYDFLIWMSRMRQYPWVTQGIVGIYAIPAHTRYGGNYAAVTLPTGGTTSVPAYQPHAGTLGTRTVAAMPGWRDAVDLGPRYQHLKKFLTYPYTVCEVTAYTGTPVILKPESWSDPDASVVEVPHFAQPAPRLAMVPYRYNAAGAAAESDAYGVVNDGGEWVNTATGVFNFPTFALVNNGYIAFMASNTHGIAFQHQSADWAQQRALAGNQTSYDQASAGINAANAQAAGLQDTATAQSQIANQATGQLTGVRMAHTGANAAMNVIGGGGVGSAVGAAVGIVADAMQSSIEIQRNTSATAVANAQTGRSAKISTDLSGLVRDTNKSLADWAAKGDYQNAIAGINAKVQDARLTQPSVSGQVGGDAFNLATSRMGYDVKIRTVSDAVRRAVGEYWLRYGYAVNMFSTLPESLAVMEKFTYWKLHETYITASGCPEKFKQTIRGIFEKGVTVWKNPTDIGNIDIADNAPLPGVTL